jgi:tetratricopeptide (TPR) repeat protein
MKTQRRHELQTNTLADTIGVYLQKVRPYEKPILYGVVAIAVLAGAVLYLSTQQQAKAGASWEDYFSAMVEQRPEALEEVARLHQGSTAALWAQQGAGDIKLAMGASLLYRDRKEAEKNLKDAEKEFLAVEQQGARYPLLLQRARYGLAQVYESLSDIEKARDYYGKVAAAEPDSALGQLAQRRRDQIAGDEADRWFAWFERQEPKPPAGMSPATGGMPKVPADLGGELPERPNLSFPASDVSKQLKEAPAQPAPAAETKPAAPPQAKSTPAPEAEPDAPPEPKPAAEPPAKPAAEPEKKPDVAKPKAETPAPAEAKQAEAAPAPSAASPPAEQPKP